MGMRGEYDIFQLYYYFYLHCESNGCNSNVQLSNQCNNHMAKPLLYSKISRLSTEYIFYLSILLGRYVPYHFELQNYMRLNCFKNTISSIILILRWSWSLIQFDLGNLKRHGQHVSSNFLLLVLLWIMFY